MKRVANVRWTGDLVKGSGLVTGATSGAFRDQPVSWASRSGDANGKTSPEELIAAAHASCFAMAFSAQLAKNGTPGTSLDVRATVTFDKVGDGFAITSSELEVNGTVAGIDDAKFQELADAAKSGCPVSQALKNNVRIELVAKLASA
ncbi:putative ATP/GTP-binding protein [Sandaracinus amylolyticus]|uniref:Putative ATP/GTP-binding protein n=1 Tax=Sandaracinus amylolyticus TaxID=927083 RepID=A0A0F6VZ29_9BACT|nr:putative ATP/GTP-binding protein [Sandaracinus amylolyticus]